MEKNSILNHQSCGQRYPKYLSLIIISLILYLSVNAMGEQKRFVASIDQDGVQQVEILAGDYYFNPNDIVLKVNVPVELKIRKEPGITPHDIIIKASEAGMDINEEISTEPKIIKFTPTKIGKFPFYCDKKFLFFKSHRERGMEGIIEVTQ
jgi:plastocyanin domain-containing protein